MSAQVERLHARAHTHTYNLALVAACSISVRLQGESQISSFLIRCFAASLLRLLFWVFLRVDRVA